MAKSTTFKCPNCDEERSVVLASDATTTEFACPNCDERIVVSFGTD